MSYAISIAMAIAITAGATAGVMHYETAVAVCPIALSPSPGADAAAKQILTPSPAAQGTGIYDLFQ